MNRVYLALGSNLIDPLHHVRNALEALDTIPQTKRSAISTLYRTPPYGPLDQPDYLNAVAALDTQLLPEALLDYTQRIELEHGRIRTTERWGARTLDLDIMLFGNWVMNTCRLTLPHYDMLNRSFMLVPLLEIAPQASLPDGSCLADILTQLDCSAIKPW